MVRLYLRLEALSGILQIDRLARSLKFGKTLEFDRDVFFVGEHVLDCIRYDIGCGASLVLCPTLDGRVQLGGDFDRANNFVHSLTLPQRGPAANEGLEAVA
ncbi:MAG: hypothetical protein KBA31_03645 [Alphaproteobacteria bacterium]|nr:hypothetical protein [Alphaproteobacteria bacterium]